MAAGARAHLLASSAIPLLFPAIRIDGELFCEGGLRQNVPLSPALHLGANRLVVVSPHHIASTDSELGKARERAQRLDLLAFQKDEIDRVAPSADEEASLVAERARLVHADRLRGIATAVLGWLSDSDSSALSQVGEAVKGVREIAALVPEQSGLLDLAGSAADFAQVVREAQMAGNVDRQVKALLDSVMPWGFLDHRRGLAVIEEAYSLPEEFHPDPADRIIVATARLKDAAVVTSDEKICEYPHVATLW